MAAYPNKVSFSLFHHFNGWSLHLSDSLVRLTTWWGLGTTFSGRWSLELACLSQQGSKTGHSACTAHHHLGTCIQPECTLNPWSDVATDFALQTREVTSCALSSNATLQRTAEWAVQLWLFSWLDTLRLIFCGEQGYELASLPRGRSSLKLVKLCYLNSSWPTPQVSCLNRGPGFTLQTISSACPSLGSPTAGLNSFPGAIVCLSGQMEPKVTLHSTWG